MVVSIEGSIKNYNKIRERQAMRVGKLERVGQFRGGGNCILKHSKEGNV